MNLKEKIQALYKSTTSAEVKAICESFLNKSDDANVEPNEKITESLFEGLKSLRSKDSRVNALLLEQESLQKNIMDMETQVSKNAAQKLMESWKGGLDNAKKVNPVGNHVNGAMVRENAGKANEEKSLKESLRAISDKDLSAKEMLGALEINSYGIAESIETLATSKLAQAQPQFKYALQRFYNHISNNVSESKIVKEYIATLANFTWDKDVNESYSIVKANVDARAAELEVQNAIYDIRATDSKRFFTGLVEKMNSWLASENRNIHSLIKEMKAFTFNPIVKDLANRLLLMESAAGTAFNVAVNSSNCNISKVYSPVILKSGAQIFRAGNSFYAATKEGVSRLSEKQVNGLPKSYLDLCEAFFNPSVKVVDDSIVVYIGKNKATITNESIKVNESQVQLDDLGNKLMLHNQGTIFGTTTPLVNVAVKLAENVNQICEVDFGKAIFSNLHEGVGVYMFRRGEKVYINKVNPSMNENRFFQANGIQAVKFVKEFLSYNVSESLSDLLSGAAKQKADMEKSLADVLNNISVLEGNLNKIEAAIAENPEIAELDEIAQAKTLVEAELNTMKSKWQEIVDSIKKFESADEEDAGEPVEIEDEKSEEPATDNQDAAPAEEPAADNQDAPPVEDEAAADAQNTDDNNGGDVPPSDDNQDGGVPTDVPPTDTTPAPAGDVLDTGLAGAEGAQDQVQTIQGNDHIDANAGAVATEDPNAPSLVDTGFNGAEGGQQPQPGEDNMADATAVPATSTTAEITVPANLAPTQAETAPAPEVTNNEPATEPAPADNQDAPPADDAGDASNPAAAEEVPATEPASNPEGEEKQNEALDTNVSVKLVGSDKTGKITAVNTAEHTYTVLWDGGESGEYSEEQLEEIKPETTENIADNVEAAEKNKVAEEEQAPEEAGQAVEPAPDVFVKATVEIDFGPYKAGEEIEISAGDYTAAGEDDPVKIKSPKEEVVTIPKKCVKIIEESGSQDEVGSKLESVVKNLEEIETIIKGNDKINSKSIEEALAKLKEFTGALSKDQGAKSE